MFAIIQNIEHPSGSWTNVELTNICLCFLPNTGKSDGGIVCRGQPCSGSVFLRTGMQLRAAEEGQRVLRCLVASTRRLPLAVEPNGSNVI
jgi:hypothetical protein